MATPTGPHAGMPLLARGAEGDARVGLVLVHGRGGSAATMLSLVDALGVPGVAVRAPQAAGSTWYPHSFLAPLESNEPGLSSGVARVEAAVLELEALGLPARHVVLLGFSQGACLTSETVLRRPRRLGGVVLLTGGFPGPDGARPAPEGDLDGTPVLLGSSDPDPHVPWTRVEQTARLLESIGGAIDLRRYPGMPHTIAEDEIEAARRILASASRPARA